MTRFSTDYYKMIHWSPHLREDIANIVIGFN